MYYFSYSQFCRGSHYFSPSQVQAVILISVCKPNLKLVFPIPASSPASSPASPSCGFPGFPSNCVVSASGQTEFYSGEIVTYSCSQGFVMFGPQARECQGGGWSKASPVCSKITCLCYNIVQFLYFRGEYCPWSASHPVTLCTRLQPW